MTVDNVEITAKCPYGCGSDATWYGAVVTQGGSTRYDRIDCPNKCPNVDEGDA